MNSLDEDSASIRASTTRSEHADVSNLAQEGRAAGKPSQSVEASRAVEPESVSHCTSFPRLGAVAPLSSQLEKAIQAYQDEYEHRHLHQLQRFLGVRFGQNPNDQQIISEILYDVKPDLIVETGTNSGGSAVWMVSMMSMINPSCKVITADVKHPDEWAAHWNKGQRAAEMASTKPQWKSVEFFRGFSTSAGFINRVAELAASARRVLVVLDSDHGTQNVKAELNALSRFVTPGSYIIAEDSYSTKTPMPAIKEFLASHPEFTTDTGRTLPHVFAASRRLLAPKLCNCEPIIAACRRQPF